MWDVLVINVDIDECTLSQPCEQECVNNIGSFECNCSVGFFLEGNGRNCSGSPRSGCIRIDTNKCILPNQMLMNVQWKVQRS
jgi:hypothetical protein